MSKGRVWNRGKHNGRGLPSRKEKKGPDNPSGNNAGGQELEPSGLTVNDTPSRANTVKLMNRENWVSRVTPAKREELDKNNRK
ncbi:hypothetical protein SAMN05518855_1007207 [Paenibacillus sp. CF384]|nr:hypothetical protein SAMN05518855_1007207 [Paenibacillus sp. CF384]